MPAGYGKVSVLEELERRLGTEPDRTIYVGDGSSDVHVMLHVNNRDGFTIAVSENKLLARIAKSTVLSDNAFSVVVPILEQIVGWRSAEIRALFESYGLTLHDWEKARTDRVTIREPPDRLDAHRVTVELPWSIPWAGLATAVFVGSYFCKRPEVLPRVQMVGALMWVAYGLLDARAAGGGGEPARLRRGGVDGEIAEGDLTDHSEASIPYMTWSTKWSYSHSRCRSTPSRTKPRRSAMAQLRMLPGAQAISTWLRPSSPKT